jgi:hypothetical protein
VGDALLSAAWRELQRRALRLAKGRGEATGEGPAAETAPLVRLLHWKRCARPLKNLPDREVPGRIWLYVIVWSQHLIGVSLFRQSGWLAPGLARENGAIKSAYRQNGPARGPLYDYTTTACIC